MSLFKRLRDNSSTKKNPQVLVGDPHGDVNSFPDYDGGEDGDGKWDPCDNRKISG